MTSSTLLADPPSNETIDVFYIKMAFEDVGYIGMAQEMSQYASLKTVMNVLSSFKAED